MDKKEIVQRGSLFLHDCARDVVDRHQEEAIALAVARQKKKDVRCAIAAFLDIKVPENEIMRLLSKFYGVDSIAAAMELVTTVKVANQIDALRAYLNEFGMDSVEITNYLREHRVKIQLLTDSKLQNMTTEKLKAYFDKH